MDINKCNYQDSRQLKSTKDIVKSISPSRNFHTSSSFFHYDPRPQYNDRTFYSMKMPSKEMKKCFLNQQSNHKKIINKINLQRSPARSFKESFKRETKSANFNKEIELLKRI